MRGGRRALMDHKACGQMVALDKEERGHTKGGTCCEERG